MTIKEANNITGGLSFPSKMPCPAYSLPIANCKMGSAFRLIEGTACSKCYASKGRYCFPNVKKALQKRVRAIYTNKWQSAMILLIKHYCSNRVFRWHDSGDLQGDWHLRSIMGIATATPDILHRLPTKEWNLIYDVAGYIPDNIIVALSSPIIDFFPVFRGKLKSFPVHTVISDVSKCPSGAVLCPATTVRHKCDSCRVCWDKSIKKVCYLLH